MKRNLVYKGVAVNRFGIPILKQDKNTSKKNGCKYNKYQHFDSVFEKTSPKNLIVIYDIPEEKKKERDWFRRHLKIFNFIMIQRSVWIGPSPLPKDFIDYVKSIGLLKQLKTFKLSKPYTGENDIYKNTI
jgi:hypothetical protein